MSMPNLQERFQQRRAELLENPEHSEDLQFVTPRSVAENRARTRELLRQQLEAMQTRTDV